MQVNHESSIVQIQYLEWSICIVGLPCTISRRLAYRTILDCSTCHGLFLLTTSSSWLCRHHLLPSSFGSFVAAWPTILYPFSVPEMEKIEQNWNVVYWMHWNWNFEVMIHCRWKFFDFIDFIHTLNKFKHHSSDIWLNSFKFATYSLENNMKILNSIDNKFLQQNSRWEFCQKSTCFVSRSDFWLNYGIFGRNYTDLEFALKYRRFCTCFRHFRIVSTQFNRKNCTFFRATEERPYSPC